MRACVHRGSQYGGGVHCMPSLWMIRIQINRRRRMMMRIGWTDTVVAEEEEDDDDPLWIYV